RRLLACSTMGSMLHVWLAIRIAGPCSGKGAIPSDSRPYHQAQISQLRPQSRRSPPRTSASDRRGGINTQGPSRNTTDRMSRFQGLIAKHPAWDEVAPESRSQLDSGTAHQKPLVNV